MLSVLRNNTPVILNWTSKFSTSDLYFKVLIIKLAVSRYGPGRGWSLYEEEKRSF